MDVHNRELAAHMDKSFNKIKQCLDEHAMHINALVHAVHSSPEALKIYDKSLRQQKADKLITALPGDERNEPDPRAEALRQFRSMASKANKSNKPKSISPEEIRAERLKLMAQSVKNLTEGTDEKS